MSSLEDIRENYKSLKQSSDQKLKLNGATCRDAWRKKKYFNENFIIKTEEINKNGIESGLDEKYFINRKDLNFSLDKKGRWKMVDELAKNMDFFNREDADVRLYETRSRINKPSNCIAVHKSKGDKVKIKYTFGNTNSIKNEALKTKNSPYDGENSDDESIKKVLANEFSEYKVQYAPKSDILKYDTRYFKKNVDHLSQSRKSSRKNAKNFDIDYHDDYFY